MKLRIALPILAAMAAFSLLAQEPAKVPTPAKPTVNTANLPTAKAPELATGKLWRLVAKTQALRVQADATDAAKAAKEAETELQAEQQALSAKCTAVGLVLGYDEKRESQTYQDLICVTKPKEQAVVAPPAAPKEK